MLLADRRTDIAPKQRNLIARLAQGAAGKALGFDLAAYTAARADALLLLRNAASEPDHTALFKMTETYRAGAEGQQKTAELLRTLSLLLEDILLLQAGTPELLRNTDLRAELERFAQSLSFQWIEQASRGLDQVQSGMRRNLLRSLSLDAFAGQLSHCCSLIILFVTSLERPSSDDPAKPLQFHRPPAGDKNNRNPSLIQLSQSSEKPAGQHLVIAPAAPLVNLRSIRSLPAIRKHHTHLATLTAPLNSLSQSIFRRRFHQHQLRPWSIVPQSNSRRRQTLRSTRQIHRLRLKHKSTSPTTAATISAVLLPADRSSSPPHPAP